MLMWNIRLIIKLFFVFILTSPPKKKSCRLIKINKAKKKNHRFYNNRTSK